MSPFPDPSPAAGTVGAIGSSASGSTFEDSMTTDSWVGFPGGGADFRSHHHHNQQSQSHHQQSQTHHQQQQATQLAELDDSSANSVTSSILSQSFSSSFNNNRSFQSSGAQSIASRRSSSIGYSAGAARRSSLLGDISESGGDPSAPTTQPQQQPQPPRRRGVRFNPRAQIQPTLSRYDYSPSEMERTWHSKQDGERMKRDVLTTVRAMRKLHERRVPAERVDFELARMFSDGGRVEADRTTTDRGLEHMRTTRSVENRKRHKRSVVDAVLDEQDLLWDEAAAEAENDDSGSGSGDPEAEALRIAEAGMVASRPARKDAIRKGQRDARTVEKWRREEEEERASAASTAKAKVAASSSSTSSSKRPPRGFRDVKLEPANTTAAAGAARRDPMTQTTRSPRLR